MTTFIIDGKDFDIPVEVVTAFARMRSRNVELEDQMHRRNMQIEDLRKNCRFLQVQLSDSFNKGARCVECSAKGVNLICEDCIGVIAGEMAGK